MRRHEPDPRHDFKEQREADQAAETEQPRRRIGFASRAGNGRRNGRVCRHLKRQGNSAATSAFLVIRPSSSASSASAWVDWRLNSVGQRGSVILAAISGVMRV